VLLSLERVAMLKQLLLVAVLVIPYAHAQQRERTHLEQFAQPELCVYKAKLAAAGAWLRIEKHATTCDNIKYFWHGDETEYEITLVKEATCKGFETVLDPIKAGDTAYLECMEWDER
jgi:hypothetical protein